MSVNPTGRGDLRPEMVGPYIALIAYARAAGARDHAQAKDIVDEVLTDPANEHRTTPDLIDQVETRARVAGAGLARP